VKKGRDLKRIAIVAMLLTIMVGLVWAGELTAREKTYKELQLMNLRAIDSNIARDYWSIEFAAKTGDPKVWRTVLDESEKRHKEISKLSSEYGDLMRTVIKAFGKIPKWWMEQQKPFDELDVKRRAEHQKFMDEMRETHKAKRGD
jgi:hypothetical protein